MVKDTLCNLLLQTKPPARLWLDKWLNQPHCPAAQRSDATSCVSTLRELPVAGDSPNGLSSLHAAAPSWVSPPRTGFCHEAQMEEPLFDVALQWSASSLQDPGGRCGVERQRAALAASRVLRAPLCVSRVWKRQLLPHLSSARERHRQGIAPMKGTVCVCSLTSEGKRTTKAAPNPRYPQARLIQTPAVSMGPITHPSLSRACRLYQASALCVLCTEKMLPRRFAPPAKGGALAGGKGAADGGGWCCSTPGLGASRWGEDKQLTGGHSGPQLVSLQYVIRLSLQPGSGISLFLYLHTWNEIGSATTWQGLLLVCQQWSQAAAFRGAICSTVPLSSSGV